MGASETIGLIGELLSWVGLTLGLPLLLLALVLRLASADTTPTEIVVVTRDDSTVARWFSSGDFHERALHHWEVERLAGRDSFEAYVSNRDPSRMRLDAHPPLLRIAGTLGIVLTVVGVCGFLASWVPVFF